MKGDFTDLLKILSKGGVDFVIVGGFAGIVYGSSDVTEDIDICCDFSTQNLLRLQKALKGLHPVHRMTPKKIKLNLTKENCRQFKNLYLDTDLGQLDCLGAISGVGNFNEVKKASVPIEVEGQKFNVLNLDALIESKKAMNRDSDKLKIVQLESIKKMKSK